MNGNSAAPIEVELHLEGSLLSLPGKRISNTLRIPSHSSLKDAVQSAGIPHTEVALIVLNGVPADWDRHFREGDCLYLYGQDMAREIGKPWRSDQPPPEPRRFLLDVHLGRLTAYLRLLGFDCEYPKQDPGDEALVRQAVSEDRILLTCDHGLLNRNAVQHGYLIRSRDSVEQTLEVIERYDLRESANPFSRCLECNTTFGPASETVIRNLAPAKVVHNLGYDPAHYQFCENCHKLFWQGTHTARMKKLLVKWGIF